MPPCADCNSNRSTTPPTADKAVVSDYLPQTRTHSQSAQAPDRVHFFFSVSYQLNCKNYRLHFLSSERASIAFGLSVALPRPPMQLAGQKPRPTLETEVHRL
ncbi:hypothetical protein [Anaerotignum sp.]|uniref:hypothetical protein n=1 Tax=Anaerotignum sp. TaxID=2039241 RepID=UPI0028A17F09|nr:hypothetical protein [Anaerotignum sp.]